MVNCGGDEIYAGAGNALRACRWFAGIVLSATLVACGGGGDGNGDEAANSALASLSDAQDSPQAPLRASAATCAFQHVYVTVQMVRVLQQLDRKDQWIEIALPTPQRIDLLDDTGGLLHALGAPALARGRYSEVRLILVDEGGEVRPEGSSAAPLKTPAAAQGGLMIKSDFVVAPAQRGDITLQGFDPCRSVLQIGAPGSPQYHLKPQLSVEVSVVAAASVDEVQRVNTTTAGSQFQASVARLQDGGYVIVWAEPGLPFSRWCAQRYTASGTRVRGEACVGTGDLVDAPVVAGLSDGGYAVAWASIDPSGTGIWAVQYRADGSATGSPHLVNTVTAGGQRDAAIAALRGGGYVVAWTSESDVYARRYDAAGVPSGPEVRVNTFNDVSGGGGRSAPAITALHDGGFAIAWTSQFQDPARSVGIYLQLFGPGGTLVGAETLVSLDGGVNPALTGLVGGGFVITWQSSTPSGIVIAAQQFAAGGTPVGSQLVAKPITAPLTTCFVPFPTPCPAENQIEPAVAALDDGGFVIAWYSEFRAGGASAIYARRYAVDGAAAGSAAPVSTTAGRRPAVTGTAGGGFTVVWDAWTGTDSDVFARHSVEGSLVTTAGP